MSKGENGILVLHNDNRKRRKASGLPHKIIKTYKGKLGQKTSHIARSRRTHTTLPCSCRACAAMSQKTGVIAGIHKSIAAREALPAANGGYRNRILCRYLSVILDIQHFMASGRTGR